MIAVDTSALMAVVLDEPEADACIAVLEAEIERTKKHRDAAGGFKASAEALFKKA